MVPAVKFVGSLGRLVLDLHGSNYFSGSCSIISEDYQSIDSQEDSPVLSPSNVMVMTVVENITNVKTSTTTWFECDSEHFPATFIYAIAAAFVMFSTWILIGRLSWLVEQRRRSARNDQFRRAALTAGMDEGLVLIANPQEQARAIEDGHALFVYDDETLLSAVAFQDARGETIWLSGNIVRAESRRSQGGTLVRMRNNAQHNGPNAEYPKRNHTQRIS
jgi:hypothetical protein